MTNNNTLLYIFLKVLLTKTWCLYNFELQKVGQNINVQIDSQSLLAKSLNATQSLLEQIKSV